MFGPHPLKFYHPVHRSLPLNPNPEPDECHPHPPTLFQIIFNNILALPRCLFPSGFQIKILYTFLISTISAAYHICLFLLYLVILIHLFLVNSSSCEACHYAVFSNLLSHPPPSLLGLNTVFNTLKHPESMFFITCIVCNFNKT